MTNVAWAKNFILTLLSLSQIDAFQLAFAANVDQSAGDDGRRADVMPQNAGAGGYGKWPSSHVLHPARSWRHDVVEKATCALGRG